MLHITNGDSAAQKIQQTGQAGDILPWKDMLHEGPVPAGLTLDQMSQVRARFIADYISEPYEEILRDFMQRDNTLARCGEHDEVILWFEHDLYDQLQILQILDWFAQQPRGMTALSLICIDTFPGVAHFIGLGQLMPEQLATLYDAHGLIEDTMLKLGSEAWQAFCSPNPVDIEIVMQRDTSPLPLLKAALLRHLEQFPALDNGLSRTERQVLEAARTGAHTPVEIFLAQQEQEESPFMGDTTLWNAIAILCAGSHPLLKRADGDAFILPSAQDKNQAFQEQELTITEEGNAVLDGSADWLKLHGGVNRWLGGVHLEGQDAAWRWDAQRKRLVQIT